MISNFLPTALIAIFLSTLVLNSSAQAKKKAAADTERWRYELICVGTGSQGTYLVKVWSYSKKPDVAKEQALKNAVHGVIFKGFPGGNNCQSQKPMARNPELQTEKAEFFEAFFNTENGAYRRYVNFTTNGVPAAGDVIKANKKEYKVGVVISINKDELRKYLESQGIIKGLDAGF